MTVSLLESASLGRRALVGSTDGCLCTSIRPQALCFPRPPLHGVWSHSLLEIRTQRADSSRVQVICAAEKDGVVGVLQEALATRRGGKLDTVYREGSEYLRLLGITNTAEITRILDVAMNPNSLYTASRERRRQYNNASARSLSVETDMKPVVAFLEQRGFSREQILRVINEHPPVLCYSPEERLAPFFDYLEGLGISDPVKLAVQRPTLLGLEVNNNLKRMVGYLQDSGYSLEKIQELLETSI